MPVKAHSIQNIEGPTIKERHFQPEEAYKNNQHVKI